MLAPASATPPDTPLLSTPKSTGATLPGDTPYAPFAEMATDHHQRVDVATYSVAKHPRGLLSVYQYRVNEQWIMWDRESGRVFWTGIWKALGRDKSELNKVMDIVDRRWRDVAERHKGGKLDIQGTWVPFELARKLADRTCYTIRHLLVPLFGADIMHTCVAPDDPAYLLPRNRPRAPRPLQPSHRSSVRGHAVNRVCTYPLTDIEMAKLLHRVKRGPTGGAIGKPVSAGAKHHPALQPLKTHHSLPEGGPRNAGTTLPPLHTLDLAPPHSPCFSTPPRNASWHTHQSFGGGYITPPMSNKQNLSVSLPSLAALKSNWPNFRTQEEAADALETSMILADMSLSASASVPASMRSSVSPASPDFPPTPVVRTELMGGGEARR